MSALACVCLYFGAKAAWEFYYAVRFAGFGADAGFAGFDVALAAVMWGTA